MWHHIVWWMYARSSEQHAACIIGQGGGHSVRIVKLACYSLCVINAQFWVNNYETSLTWNGAWHKFVDASFPPLSHCLAFSLSVFSSSLPSCCPPLPPLRLVHMCACSPLNEEMFVSLIQSWTCCKIHCRTGSSKETGRRRAPETIRRAGCTHCC